MSVRYHPACVDGRKSKFQLKLLNLGLLASYKTQDPKLKILLNKLDGYAFMTQMFDIFVIFTHLDFRESAEFNKNKD